MAKFELVPPDAEHNSPYDEEPYYEPCDYCGGKVVVTGGKVVVTGGNSYYNGSYSCYTLHLECENCGPYEVECV